MKVMMSWARSTMANVDTKLGHTEHTFDFMLIGVMVLLAFASLVLFSQ